MNRTTQPSQRKAHRLLVKLPFSLVAGAGGKEVTIPAESINLSKSGMRLRSQTELSFGQIVEVILTEGTPHPVRARVVWVWKPTTSNQYEFGLEYVTPSARQV
ncbi:MAG: PilZ domain-containing protein [Terriglobia bacterium]